MIIRICSSTAFLLIFSLCLFLFGQIQASASSRTPATHVMRGLVIFHRHGARLPAVEDYYAEDWGPNLQRGDLTDKGIAQLHKLGKQIRKKYIEDMKFLPRAYDGSIFKVRIAQLSRCMLSLLSLLNGLYPDIYQREHQTSASLLAPKKQLRFSLDLNQHKTRDLMFRAQSPKNCRMMTHIYTRRQNEDKFEVMFGYFLNHPVMKSALDKLEAYRQTRGGKSIQVKDMYYIKEIYDSYLCNKIQGNPVPAWNKAELKLLQLNYEMFFYSYFGFREARKVTATKFFQEILEFFKVLIANPSNHEKLLIFSGTKTNIAIILSNILIKQQIISLGSEKIPPLSATMFFELWEKTDQPDLPANERFYFKILYGKIELEIHTCAIKKRCTWREFKILLKTRIKPNIRDFCDLGMLYETPNYD